jgi:hypothetical protein
MADALRDAEAPLFHGTFTGISSFVFPRYCLLARTKLTNNVLPLRVFQHATLILLGVFATRLGRGDKQFPQAVAHG